MKCYASKTWLKNKPNSVMDWLAVVAMGLSVFIPFALWYTGAL